MTSEVKVGLFTLAGILALVYFTFKVGKGFIGESYPLKLKATFDNITGVQPRAPVQVAGVKVGEVESIILDNNKATVWMQLKGDVKLPKDSVAEIKTQGLLGDTYITLVPGKESAAILETGSELAKSRSPVELDQLIQSLSAVGEDIKAITGTLRKVIATEETEGDLKSIIENVKMMTQNMNELVAKNEDRLERVLINIEDLSGGARDVVKDNKEVLKEILQNFRSVSQNLEGILSGNKGNIDESLATVRDATRKLDETLASISSITKKIDEGKGSIGRLVNDDTVALKAEEALEGASVLLGSTQKFVTTFGYRAEYLASPGDFKNYFSVKIQPRKDRFYILEAVTNPLTRISQDETFQETTIEGNPPYTTGDPPYVYTTKTVKERADDDNLLFTAQIAQRFNWFVLRGGIIESTGGLGSDLLFFNDRFKLSLDAFDFSPDEEERSNANLKLSSKLTFYPNLNLFAGGDDLLNNRTEHDTGRSVFFGLGFEFTDDDLKTLVLRAGIPGF